MDLSNGTGKHMLMQPLSDTVFFLPDVKRIRTTCEFILENGKVKKVITVQEKRVEWIKIK